jgi:hypothetical protein
VSSDPGGGVGDPALVVFDAPVGLEVVDGLGEIVGDGMDGGAVAGPAEGDVGELPTTTGGEVVRALVGGALGAVDGERVGIVEVPGVDRCACQGHFPAVAGVGVDPVGGERGDGQHFAGHDAGSGAGGEGDDAVADGVGAAAGHGDVVAVEVADAVPVVAGEAVEIGDVGSAPG